METGNANNSSSSSSNHLPWLWVIETLADCKQVDIALIYDLITRVSELTDESWVETAKEILALKQLEDLFCGSDSNGVNYSNKVTIFELNVSDRAQDVLTRLLRLMEVSNMKKLLLKFLNWDVCQFIHKKRASLRKYDLHQLKTAILEGVDPSLTVLGERSGLDKEYDKIERIPVDNDGPDAEVLRSDKEGEEETRFLIQSGSPDAAAEKIGQSMGEDSLGDDLNFRKESPEKHNRIECLDECRIGRDSVNNAAENLEQSLKDGEDHETNRDVVLLVPENMREIVQEKHPDRYLITGKRRRSSFSKVEVAPNLEKYAYYRHTGIKSVKKKGKLDSIGQNSAPPDRNELVQDPPGRGLSSGGKEVSELAKGTQVRDLQEDGTSVDLSDGFEYLALKRLKQGITDGEIVHNQSQLPSNDGEMPQEARLNGHHQNNLLDEGKDDSDHHTMLGRSDGNDENIDETPSIDSDEEMVIVAKKRIFLSSLNAFNQDSQTSSEWAEQSICMNCYKGGQLLTCSTSSCPLAVHESCLSSASFSGSGNFYCPFCSYLQATVAYREIKKKAVLIKDKEALARDRLVKYTHVVSARRQTQSSEITPLEEQVQAPKAGDVPSSSGAPTSPATERNGIQEAREDHREQVRNHKNTRVVEDQECAEPCATHKSNSFPQCFENATLNCKNTQNVSLNKERDNVEMDEERRQSVSTEERNKEKSRSKSNDWPCADEEAALIHKEHDVQQENENLRLAIVPYRENYCKLNLISNKIAENQDNARLFVNVRRSLRFSAQGSNRIVSSSKRETIAWTAEEEEILKEGVRRFSGKGENVPWKMILEFGHHVFDESRTRVDLKNKWNNMYKKESRRTSFRKNSV